MIRTWLLRVFLLLGTFASAEAVPAASVRPAAAVFCVFDCSAGARPTWPGRCYEPTKTFSTGGTSWLTLKTRYDNGCADVFDCGATVPKLLPGWAGESAGDMTWEGWFRVLAPPNASVGRNSLIGSYGAHHDSEYWSQNGIPSARRRHGAVWIDPSGYLSVTTNTGRSTGYINGPNVSDARWHHIAVAWKNETGGNQIALDFIVFNVDIDRVMDVKQPTNLYADIIAITKNALAALAKVTIGDIVVVTQDLSVRKVGGYWRFGVNTTINAPVTSDISDTVARLSSRVAVAREVSLGIRNRIMQQPNDAYPIKPFGSTPIRADDFTSAVLRTRGSVSLYVDSIIQPGKITFDPGNDLLVNDNDLVVGGGHQGRALHAEVQHFRVWSRALTPELLTVVSGCKMPEASTLFGKVFPHDLYGDFTLDGSFSNNVVDEAGNEVLPSLTSTGSFVRGGQCGHMRCPESSADGCPLVKSRELNFNSSEACDSFARFNFCRRAGAQRERPPYPYFDGCHAGGGNEIAEITLPSRVVT